MFTTLLASRPRQAGSSHGTIVSLALHGTILTAAIVAGMQRPPVFDAPRDTRIVPLSFPSAHPAPRAATPRPAAPVPPTLATPTLPTLPVPTEVPTGISVPTAEPWSPSEALPAGDPTLTAGTPSDAAPSTIGGVLGAGDVQQPAALRSSSPLPRYPEVLRAQRLEGRAIARFVVGVDGRVELGTVSIIESSHPAFAEAVRASLGRLRFTPGRVERRAVRQWVELPFGFKLDAR